MTSTDGPDGLTHVHSGKVRDLYRLPDGRLLMVASDRISAFDYVLDSTIPDKGRVLTAMTVWWFEQLADLVPNHLLSVDDPLIPAAWRGRAMICRPLRMVPVEAVARGYLAGSGLLDYQRTGAVCGVPLPPGLVDGDELPAPIFTPATKAEVGAHDENVSFEDVAATVGLETAQRLRELTLAIYAAAREIARERGILLADTKFEFGLDEATGDIILIDEALTPDSSRFWDAATYEPGRAQASFDKQFVRDWLEAQPWDKTAPGPALPTDVVAGTRARYVEAYERITGASFARYLEEDVIAP